MSKVVDLSKAHAFWGLEREGKISLFSDRTPMLATSESRVLTWAEPGEQPVKVYLVVEE